ncbi:MAG: hypothetical protein VB008_00585 [Candidatus Elulimicrobiales bacterium]|nr:hypothetical protein [Candidatus Elulimicrobiales bacterium]
MKKSRNKYYRPFRDKLKTWAFFLLLAFILVYFSFKIFNYFTGPKIEILSPLPYETISGETFFIHGNVKNARNIYLNGREISINEKGDFEEELISKEPYTLVVIHAIDKYNKEKSVILQVGKE